MRPYDQLDFKDQGLSVSGALAQMPRPSSRLGLIKDTARGVIGQNRVDSVTRHGRLVFFVHFFTNFEKTIAKVKIVCYNSCIFICFAVLDKYTYTKRITYVGF